MKIQSTLLLGALALVMTGCYNDPRITRNAPGSSEVETHARPSVGPGTVNGGSTAGPQPASRHTEKSDHGSAEATDSTETHKQPAAKH